MIRDFSVVGALSLVGTVLGLFHVALSIRALRTSRWGGILALLIPGAAPWLAVRQGARKAAATYGIVVLVYLVLLMFAVR